MAELPARRSLERCPYKVGARAFHSRYGGGTVAFVGEASELDPKHPLFVGLSLDSPHGTHNGDTGASQRREGPDG